MRAQAFGVKCTYTQIQFQRRSRNPVDRQNLRPYSGSTVPALLKRTVDSQWRASGSGYRVSSVAGRLSKLLDRCRGEATEGSTREVHSTSDAPQSGVMLLPTTQATHYHLAALKIETGASGPRMKRAMRPNVACSGHRKGETG
jgi:hypothetical protein